MAQKVAINPETPKNENAKIQFVSKLIGWWLFVISIINPNIAGVIDPNPIPKIER